MATSHYPFIVSNRDSNQPGKPTPGLSATASPIKPEAWNSARQNGASPLEPVSRDQGQQRRTSL